jgi:hypothetical protein
MRKETDVLLGELFQHVLGNTKYLRIVSLGAKISNPGPPEHEAGVLLYLPLYSLKEYTECSASKET